MQSQILIPKKSTVIVCSKDKLYSIVPLTYINMVQSHWSQGPYYIVRLFLNILESVPFAI